MKPLNAKDIEKLENTSIASALAAASVASVDDLVNGPCPIASVCVVGSECVINTCNQDSHCDKTCDNSVCDDSCCEETAQCDATCIDTCDASACLPGILPGAGFTQLLRNALQA